MEREKHMKREKHIKYVIALVVIILLIIGFHLIGSSLLPMIKNHMGL